MLTALAMAPVARANGAFPDEFSIHFPAGAPHRILVGANFGLLVSEDDGATWRYACEPWITAGSSAALSQNSVDFYQLTADGSVIAQSREVTRSDDVGCTWPVAGGVITARVVTDLFPDPNDPTLVLAVLVSASGSSIVASHDGGKTFVDPPLYQTGELLTGIELSTTSPRVIYATSVPFSGTGATMVRSDDSGMTWNPTSIPIPAGTEPLIVQIDPQDSDTVYLRVVGTLTDSIWVTTDGGANFSPILTITGQFSSFLRATDGTLYAGTLAGQLYVQPAGDTAFTHHDAPHFRCLGQRPGTSRIFACGDMGLDGFSVGYSDDGGRTFQRMMNFIDLLGPLTCTPVATNCTAHWERIQGVLGIAVPDGGVPDAGTTDAGTPPDGGTVTPPPPGGGGSSCSTTQDGFASVLGLVAFVVLWRVGSPRRREVEMNDTRIRAMGPLLSLAVVVSLSFAACSDSSPEGGPVTGAQDTHCSLPDGGVQAQAVDLSTCHQAVGDAGAPDYGETRYNTESDDDDCKYHVKFSATPVRENENVNFTVTASTKADGLPATGAAVSAEVYLSTTHPAPNSGQATSETGGGVYQVGPIKFDAAGRWTIRFHLHEECQDTTEDSPHGHVAFYIDVP